MKLLDVLTSPWAIEPAKLREIQEIYSTHLRGEKIDVKGIEAQLGRPLENSRRGYEVHSNVAIVPLVGVMAKRMNLFSQISGGASTELVATALQQAVKDPEVEGIILEVDSPGGTVDGTAELANLVRGLRDEKPIVTWVNGLAASAAYWVGSATSRMFISSSTAKVGSIGVVMTHLDRSEFDKKMGLKVTHIYAGKYKVVGSPYKALSKSDQESIQADIDYLYSLFVDAVAANRDTSVGDVLDNMADGRIFIGQQAIDAGLVDGVSTLEALVAQMSTGELPEPENTSAGAPIVYGNILQESKITGKQNLVEIDISGHDPRNSMQLSDEERSRLIDAVERSMQGRHDSQQRLALEPKTKEDVMSDKQLTKGHIIENYPDIAADLRAEGKAEIDEDALRKEGAEAERSRIKSVLDQSLPGYEAEIQEMAFDGETTGEQAAVKVLQLEKKKQAETAEDLHEDGKDLSKVRPTTGSDPNIEEGTGKDKNLASKPFDERCQAEFDASTELQAEFKTVDRYKAYRKNMGWEDDEKK